MTVRRLLLFVILLPHTKTVSHRKKNLLFFILLGVNDAKLFFDVTQLILFIF